MVSSTLVRTTAGFAAIVLVAASAVADPQRETPVEGRPAFEAATIKLAAPGAVRNQLMATRPNRLIDPQHDADVTDLRRLW